MVPQQPPHALPCKFLTSERRYHPSSVLRARSGPAPSKRRLMVFFSLSKTKCLFCSTCKLLSARCATRRRNFGTSQNLRQIPPLQRDSARRLHTSPLQPGRQIPSSAGIMQVLRLEVRSTSPHHLQRTVHDPRHHAPLLVGGHFVLIPSPFLATGLSDCSPPSFWGRTDGRVLLMHQSALRILRGMLDQDPGRNLPIVTVPSRWPPAGGVLSAAQTLTLNIILSA